MVSHNGMNEAYHFLYTNSIPAEIITWQSRIYGSSNAYLFLQQNFENSVHTYLYRHMFPLIKDDMIEVIWSMLDTNLFAIRRIFLGAPIWSFLFAIV